MGEFASEKLFKIVFDDMLMFTTSFIVLSGILVPPLPRMKNLNNIVSNFFFNFCLPRFLSS